MDVCYGNGRLRGQKNTGSAGGVARVEGRKMRYIRCNSFAGKRLVSSREDVRGWVLCDVGLPVLHGGEKYLA